MLYENTVAPATLGLLKELMQIMLKKISWKQVKGKIERAVQDYWKG